jgi:glycosyltransferase involved in cell wall biosynthesis
MRVAVLWTKLSGYLDSCLRALAAVEGTELFVSYQESTPDAPFADEQFRWILTPYRYPELPVASELLSRLRNFRPDVMIVCGWHVPAYREACRAMRGQALRVCCADNPWVGSARQWLGAVTSPIFVQRLFDAAFVPGDHQFKLMRHLGFPPERIWRGSLSCDQPAFAAIHAMRRQQPVVQSFLYAGRLDANKNSDKAIDVLRQAYLAYRTQSTDPWPLLVAGDGPMRCLLEGVAGAELIGFVQPSDLPVIMLRAGCLVLPSRVEHWGVVLHEAAAAGMPIICTSTCGGAIHLVHDGYNGAVIPPGNAQELTAAMLRLSSLDDSRLRQMGEASFQLSQQFTPQLWAQRVLQDGAALRLRLGMDAH